jgi:hypothetical protein
VPWQYPVKVTTFFSCVVAPLPSAAENVFSVTILLPSYLNTVFFNGSLADELGIVDECVTPPFAVSDSAMVSERAPNPQTSAPVPFDPALSDQQKPAATAS